MLTYCILLINEVDHNYTVAFNHYNLAYTLSVFRDVYTGKRRLAVILEEAE